MLKIPLLWLGLVLAISAHGAEEKLRQALENGPVTSDFLKKLTADDVPEKFKTEKETKETGNVITRLYKRGGSQRLRVTWFKDAKGDKKDTFLATVYDGDTRLASIDHASGSTHIVPADDPKGYSVSTTIKDDGQVTVLFMNEANSFLEGVSVRGRDTHITDDLEYTKATLSMNWFIKPLLETLKETVGDSPKEATKKKEQN